MLSVVMLNVINSERHYVEYRYAECHGLKGVKANSIHTLYPKTPYSESMEQLALENVKNCLNTNIYSYLETSGGQSSDLYINVIHFFNTSVY